MRQISNSDSMWFIQLHEFFKFTTITKLNSVFELASKLYAILMMTCQRNGLLTLLEHNKVCNDARMLEVECYSCIVDPQNISYSFFSSSFILFHFLQLERLLYVSIYGKKQHFKKSDRTLKSSMSTSGIH